MNALLRARTAARTAGALLWLLVVAPAPAQTAASDGNGTSPAAGIQPARPGVRPAGHSPALKSRTPVTVNFVNADLEAVTRAMAAMLDRQIVIDPRVKGTVTVYSEQPILPREAYLTYLAALRGLGFTVVEVAGLLKVVPEADAKLQAGTVEVGPGVTVRGDQVITQIFPLKHENPNNLVAVLRPLISPNNTINASPGTASLVITDYADNLQRIAKIVAALDQPTATEFEVIVLNHAVAADLAPVVQRLADSGAGAALPGVVVAGGAGITVLPDSRSNALLVRAPGSRMAGVKDVIAKLDRPSSGAGGTGNVWVVHLKNADAVRLAQVLRAAYPGGGSGGASGGGTFAAPTAPSAGPGGAGGASAQATAPISASAQPSTGGYIQADPATNSLIITAPEPLYRQLRAMIEQLDTRRAQVYIESLIVEVSGDNLAEFGFQWQGLTALGGDRFGLAAGTNFNSPGGPSIVSLSASVAGGSGGAPGEGLNIGLIKNYGGTYALAAIARLLQTQTSTNIVSTPNLITLDNEEAKIVVGENVPFITGQFTNTGTSVANPFQTIERKDVGITLRIKPQIGEGGTVRMTIFQEQSSVKTTTAAGTTNAGPSTTKRSIESNIVVDDGQVMVLGGLIEDRFEEHKSKVPLLGDLPWIGQLFRSESRERKRSNLLVFLRPVVMRTAEDASKLSLDRYEMIRARQQEAQPAAHPLLPVNPGAALPATPGLAPGAVAPAGAASGSAPAGPRN